MTGVGSCAGRVCIVTGAGRGLGREYALALAHHGAKVVVNDVGASRDGAGADVGPADDVVAEITAKGGDAIANADDISTWAGAARVVEQAVDTFGGLDVLVNNAGILRDRMLFSMTEEDWDSVVRVHLKGTFAPSRHAAAYWRDRSKAGEVNDARLINTTSVSGLYANPAQTNYGSAKAGIACFTQIAAQELARYGVTVNAIAPGALTRLTEDLPMSDDIRSNFSPASVAPVVTWLASTDSADVTGQVIEASGLVLAIAEGWQRGPTTEPVATPGDVGPAVRRLLGDARPRTWFQEVS
jgi:NAD(P)-dependent dehydrogenase (short-subunit alcohol dehydrogenase family)